MTHIAGCVLPLARENRKAFIEQEWPDKATRDAGQKAIFAEMEDAGDDNPMPFDGKRDLGRLRGCQRRRIAWRAEGGLSGCT